MGEFYAHKGFAFISYFRQHCFQKLRLQFIRETNQRARTIERIQRVRFFNSLLEAAKKFDTLVLDFRLFVCLIKV